MIKDYIYSHREDLLSDLSQLIRIPSVKGEAQAGAPFGTQARLALDKMTELCNSYGFDTEIFSDVVGTAELKGRESDILLGILCHLDVVPVETSCWNTNPFELTEKNGVLYGRGVIDDKGPAVASLLAMRCIKELNIPLKKGVKLIFGTDEENGSEDMEIYCKDNKLPPYVFTPDGSFPVINIEKGMMRSRFSGSYNGGSVKSFHGGKIPNAVPDSACAVVSDIPSEVIEKTALKYPSLEISVTEHNGETTINCTGKAAHASTPQGGINAVTGLISILSELPLKAGRQAEIIRGLAAQFPFGETDGASCGLRASDEKSGALTCVFSIFNMSENECGGTVDVRFPTCLNLDIVEKTERAAFAKANCQFESYMGDDPHCVDENSDFVQSLLRVYEKCEGVKGECIAIGGGTYVHNVEGGVAFGVERGDTDYHMHGADEYITIDELLRDAVIFAEAIIDICGK